MQYKDYYNILGVSRTATADEIKRAYRKLARKYHPDVSKEPDAEARFKDIGEAYEVLKDPQKRAEYDSLGTARRAGEEFTPPPGWNSRAHFGGGGYTEVDPSEFSDFFASLFGERGFTRGHRRSAYTSFDQRGEDLHSKLSIDLEDAFHGATRTLQIPITQRAADGSLATQTKTLNVKIPAGITSGQQIRLTGQGGPGMGKGAAGDLYLEITFNKHALFRVEDRNIFLNLPITPWEAALGATVAVPTLGGRVDLKIPAGSQSGQSLRLKGRGLPGNPAGDQYVQLQIVTPPADTAAAKEIYQKMADTFKFNPRAKMGL